MSTLNILTPIETTQGSTVAPATIIRLQLKDGRSPREFARWSEPLERAVERYCQFGQRLLIEFMAKNLESE
jgi:hypothetical protein